MPGGTLNVGETPAEGVAREALEETGIHCRPVALVAVNDSRLCGTVSRYHLYQFTFLCEQLEDSIIDQPSHAEEVLETHLFTEESLPEEIDPGHISRIPEAFRTWRMGSNTFFDKIEGS